jgi:lipopolysaccharide biosynthesis regulator YciM
MMLPSTEVGLFWLLLPIAALVSWTLARHGMERRRGAQVDRLRSTYFRGLNYLLNEQQDKAIEVFLQIAEVDSDTVETQLALGNLFRRRGEVDRAIRVHQALVSRASLSSEQKTQALLELGEDYMRAGLLDRAETLFADLVGVGAGAPRALAHLVAIYQQERDWHKAIEHARRLEQVTGDSRAREIAQYHCELAEQALARGDTAEARRQIDEAFATEPGAVRALILSARIALAAGDHPAAARAYEQVVERDIEFVPEVLKPLLACYGTLGEPHRAEGILRSLIERYPGISPVLALSRLIEDRDGAVAAASFLAGQLRRRPSVRGLGALIDLESRRGDGREAGTLTLLGELTRQLAEGHAVYRCTRCGFGARSHHWQCPGCKSWASVRPIHGAAGD